MESLIKGFPNLHKNSGLIRGKEVCVESAVSVKWWKIKILVVK